MAKNYPLKNDHAQLQGILGHLEKILMIENRLNFASGGFNFLVELNFQAL